MSSIAWHFEDVDLRMGGRERYRMNRLVREMALSAARMVLPRDEKPPDYAFSDDGFGEALATAWAMGSRPVRLAAVIVGCCEANLVIDGAAFAEVADTLEEGLTSGIFREETQGYEGIHAIIERLRKGGAWCALSHSVTDGFPRNSMTPEETVALIRQDGPTLAAGELAALTFFGELECVFKLSVERLAGLAGAVEGRR